MKFNLLFDLDGTLTDPKEEITQGICYALEQMGRVAPDPQTLIWCIGPPLHDSFSKLLETDSDEDCIKALTHYRKHSWSRGFDGIQSYSGIDELLSTLAAQGHMLYVATSKPTVRAQQIISHFGWSPLFKAVYGSELDGSRSNKAELIRYIMEINRLSPGKTIMIGDREHDVIGAVANGIKTIGVLWGYGSRKELESAQVDHCVESRDDLQTCIADIVID